MYNIIKFLYNQDSSLFLTHVHIAQTELNSTDLKCNDAVFSSSKSIKHGDKNPRYRLFLKTALLHSVEVQSQPSPVDSMREAMLTLSPNRQYLGIACPTTPVHLRDPQQQQQQHPFTRYDTIRYEMLF